MTGNASRLMLQLQAHSIQMQKNNPLTPSHIPALFSKYRKLTLRFSDAGENHRFQNKFMDLTHNALIEIGIKD